MDNIGGAEIVSLHLTRELNADLYTTNIDKEKIKKMGFSDLIDKIKSIGDVPKNPPFRHQAALYKFRKLNLKKQYDFYIISGDWAVSGAVNNKPNMWYVHGPINELWQFKDYVRKNIVDWYKRPFFDMWVLLNRFLTKKYSKNIDIWVCNSKNTQNRIKKYYQADSDIIYPPIDSKKFYYRKNKKYFLSVNRLTKHKRVEMQLKAFAKMPKEKLLIIGSYEKGVKQFEKIKKYIESKKTKNIEVISWVPDDELKKLYAECKCLIATTKDEDFGMTVVEAMASGKPVIAANQGGYRETIIDGENGILIDKINYKKIISAVKKINEKNSEDYRIKCMNRAKIFDIRNFTNSIKNKIRNKIK